jgi:exodeoxyribonuclease VII large subunit
MAAHGISRNLSARFPELWFLGEVISWKAGRYGAVFAEARDVNARIDLQCKQAVADTVEGLRDGESLLIKGKLCYRQTTGRVYILASELRRTDAEGEQTAARAALRRTLEAEGMFSRSKRKLPEWPTAIALVTSSSGAARHDVAAVVDRRAPWVTIQLFDTTVQGPDAPAALVDALRAAGRSGADVVLLARGGGASDDLKAFDAESVVRAVANCPIPIVSAIGHGSDTPLTDMAADQCAATPSVAAEIATPDRLALAAERRRLRQRLDLAADRAVSTAEACLAQAGLRLSPSRTRVPQLLHERLAARRPSLLQRHIKTVLDRQRETTRERKDRVERAVAAALVRETAVVTRKHQQLRMACDRALERSAFKVSALGSSLRALSPHSILTRGYGIVATNGCTVRSVANVRPDDELRISTADGEIVATVSSITPQHLKRGMHDTAREQ